MGLDPAFGGVDFAILFLLAILGCDEQRNFEFGIAEE
jgi:hypothetical protein